MTISTMPRRAGLAGALALLGALAFATAGMAQTSGETKPAEPQASGTTPAGGEPKPDETTWVHLCTKDPQSNKKVCLVTQEVRTEQGQFVASISVRSIEGDAKKTMLVAVPPGTLIVPGLRVQVDEGKQVPGQYTICLPNACYAEMEITDEFITSMKKGNNLILSVINNQAKAVGIGLTLVGFTKSYDGPPIDSAELEKRRKALQDGLKARAEQMRSQQGGDAAGGDAKPKEAPAQ